MLRHAIVTVSLLALFPLTASRTAPRPQSESSTPFAGQFVGVVQNESAKVTAEFGIVVQDMNGALSGCMAVQQPLVGSGPLSGNATGTDVSFAVTSVAGRITFVGKRSVNTVTGIYSVEHQDRPTELGTFTLARINSEVPRNASDISVCPTDAEVHQQRHAENQPAAGPSGQLAVAIRNPSVPGAASQGKVISFACAPPNGVYLCSPKWVEDWVKKNAKKYPNIHFSQSPVAGAANYLIVFSTSTSALSGFQPVVHSDSTTSAADVSGQGAAADNFGSTWTYTYQGTATVTTMTRTQEDVPYTVETTTIYASAYGGPVNLLVAQNSESTSRQQGGDPYQKLGANLGGLIGRIRIKTRLLDGVVRDIAKLP